MTEVIMPKMGDGMEEGTLLEWLKKDGDAVKSGEVIGNIQTDKATLELEAPGSGTLTGILLQPGETVPVGRPIALILKKGESVPTGWGTGSAPAPAAAPEEAPAAAAAPAAEPMAAAPSVSDARVKASPLAKKIAAEAGLDLAGVSGSGPGGRVVEKDVRAAIANQGVKIPAFSAPAAAAAPGDTKIALSRLRGITAKRTQQSKQEVPHFYVTLEVDIEGIVSIREAFKREESGNVSVNDFVVRAVALALRQMPEVNATFMGDHILSHGAVNIGIAAAIDEGLTVPVIRNADAMTCRQISAASKDLVSRAKEGKLSLDELSGSTFSISNMGMLNVDSFAAIVNQPNAGIIAIGTAKRIPVVTEDDDIEIRTRMNITGSFDHRVVDGAVGAKFMNVVRDFLQNPTRLLS